MTQLVYGDGWDDIKDCCRGGLFTDAICPTHDRGGYKSRGSSCTRTQVAVGVAFLWLFILTIVAIVLGSSISSTSNSHLSTRLDALHSEEREKHSSHSRVLDDLTSSHRNLKGRVEGVAGGLDRLSADVDRLDGSLRSHVQDRLDSVRSTLMEALTRVGQSIEQIRNDVERGMVKKKKKK